jgi:predicted lipoprotein with Yx(FWY)xxD motif
MNSPTVALTSPGVTRISWARRTAIASLVGAVASFAPLTLAGATGSQLQKITVKPYSGILANAKRHTLYVLSVEKGGTLHCKSACTPIWPPLLVKSSVTSLSIGAGVVGRIGFIKRSATMKQVTYNGFPVYTFSGDSGPSQVNGQGIVADDGTWHLTNASARTAATTSKIAANSATTTTTSGGGGYG